ncbi:hypothetical protein Poly59_53590 [Rubripirellula reticaptiva]|uniref:Uncharacterized protein n=1 Tax=Rubripirellula reticaptiva TaxID=2528013 RepID=A0A5C6EEJ8_9BACT|nr:hypothetical protein Poly59_53590 [Rubripirellula reticaptiva]
MFSVVGGIGSLSLLLAVAAVLMIGTTKLAEDWLNSLASFTLVMLMIQTIAIPTLAIFSFVTATSFFWFRSVLLRVIVAAVAVSFGFAVFATMFRLIEGASIEEMLLQSGTCLFAQFVATATVALFVQFFTPYTLSHAQPLDSAPIPPTGLRNFFELTVFFAVGFAILVAVGTEDLHAGLVFFGAWGVVSTISIITLMISTMQSGANNRIGWWVAMFFAIGCSALLNGFYAVGLFGWSFQLTNAAIVVAVSIYGALVFAASFAVCIALLQEFQWSVINRNTVTTEHS